MSLRKNALILIENKVINKECLQNLADFIYQEYQKVILSPDLDHYFKVYIKCFERVSYDDTSVEVFKTNSEIYKERIKSIEIEAKAGDKLYIKLRLNHGHIIVDEKYFSDSDIEIGGSDITKIHDIQARINQELKAIPERKNFFTQNFVWFAIIVFLLSMFTFGFLIDSLNSNTKNYTPYWRDAITDIPSFVGYTILAGLFGGLIGYAGFEKFANRSRDVWPVVELSLGPDHFRPELKQRRYWGQFILLVIIPLLVAIAYDLAKIIIYNSK